MIRIIEMLRKFAALLFLILVLAPIGQAEGYKVESIGP
jgi:hypothetical protein